MPSQCAHAPAAACDTHTQVHTVTDMHACAWPTSKNMKPCWLAHSRPSLAATRLPGRSHLVATTATTCSSGSRSSSVSCSSWWQQPELQLACASRGSGVAGTWSAVRDLQHSYAACYAAWLDPSTLTHPCAGLSSCLGVP